MIDKATFNAQLEKETTDSLPSSQYAELLEEYPYFQAARALYLKALKKENSFSYNHALKVTAAYTEDRGVLFDYITSPVFKQLEKARQIKIRLSEELESDLSLAPEEASKVFDPDLFQPEQAEELKASELENSTAADQNEAPVTEDVLEDECGKIKRILPNVKVGYILDKDGLLGEKCSPTDFGKEVFSKLIQNNIVWYRGVENE